jgi:hypothetical protein
MKPVAFDYERPTHACRRGDAARAGERLFRKFLGGRAVARADAEPSPRQPDLLVDITSIPSSPR